MLAQRSAAELIDALEIDASAYEQCVANFEQSPWGDRLFCYHASLEEFTEEIEDKYDLIVSNPPFYTNPFDTQNDARNRARFEALCPLSILSLRLINYCPTTVNFVLLSPTVQKKRFVVWPKSKGCFAIIYCMFVAKNKEKSSVA